MFRKILILPLLLATALPAAAQQVTGSDLDKILERAEAILQEAKASYESAREKSSVAGFVEAGFKLEEARIKFIVLQEIGSAEKQKLAAERLRAINQLGKLIHDGKVAISGAPADPGAGKPAAAPEPARPDAKPAPLEKPPVDVTKRAPLPDAAKQREAEKLVRDLYKEQYAKKSPADRKVLARILLGEAAKNQEDSAALWILCRESQDLASQTCDVRTLIDAIELAARFLDIDVLALKNSGLTAAAKNAKTPEECVAAAEAMNALIDELAAADQFDAAEKLANAAAPIAKRSNIPTLVSRAALRARETGEAKTLYQGMKSVLEMLAKNPEDPAANQETGQYLCYVKGSWELGLRFIVKGSDPTIKGLAQKELDQPAGSSERVDLADSWSGLGEKEKSPLRRSQMMAHAKVLYESALADAAPLLRAKIEKRLAAMESGTGDRLPVDLLKLLDPTQDCLKGMWTPGPDGRMTAQKGQAFIQVPYLLPDEYDLKMIVIPSKGSEIYLGLVLEKVQFDLSIDGWAGTISGLGSIDGKMANANETAKRGQVLKVDAPNTILCSVRKTSIMVTVNGERIITWKPEVGRLSMNNFWTRQNTGTLALGAWIPYSVTKLELTGITGRGKNLR